jgi:hypothetical protein
MRFFAVLTLAVCMMAGRTALGAELIWDGAPGCPEREDVVFRIERALDGSLAAAAPVHFEARVQRSRAGFSAVLDVSDSSHVEGKQRTLSAPDCAKLADAVAVAVTLALGAREVPANDVSAASAAVEATLPLAPAPPPVPASADEPQPAPHDESTVPALAVSVWFLGDAGSLPALGAGAALGVELGWSRFQLRGAGLIVFEQHVDRAGQGLGADAGADLSLFAGSLSACAAALGSFRAGNTLFLCAGPELGRLSGSGTGVSERRSGGGLWLAPRVDLGGFWRLPGSNLALGALVSAAVPLARAEFLLDGSLPVHRAASVVGRLSLGVELTLD